MSRYTTHDTGDDIYLFGPATEDATRPTVARFVEGTHDLAKLAALVFANQGLLAEIADFALHAGRWTREERAVMERWANKEVQFEDSSAIVYGGCDGDGEMGGDERTAG